MFDKDLQLRIDKYLNAVNITKRRTISQDMCESGVVFIDGAQAKPAKDVKVGNIIEIRYLQGAKRYKVLQIPTLKNIPKSQKEEYVQELDS